LPAIDEYVQNYAHVHCVSWYVKACTVKNYLSEVAKAIQNRCQQYLHTHPGIILPWLSPICAHSKTRLASDISACYHELEQWEN
jgi:hypothetical protein